MVDLIHRSSQSIVLTVLTEWIDRPLSLLKFPPIMAIPSCLRLVANIASTTGIRMAIRTKSVHLSLLSANMSSCLQNINGTCYPFFGVGLGF